MRWAARAARRRNVETFQRPPSGAARPLFSNVSRTIKGDIGVISRADGLWPLIISSLCLC